MQTVSQDYLTIAAGQHRVETRVKIGSTTFGEDSLFGVTVTGALYNTRRFSIGSCVSREIEVRFLLGNATIPRMAKIQPEIRLVNDNGDQSEWIPKGTFWLDTRELDKESGIMTIRGYDSMLKGEQTYISGLTGNWPKYMTTVANEIAGMLALTMDSRNNLNSTYQMQLPSGYRIREVLGYIAVANCGNWVITDEGKLRLIRVNDTVDSVSIGLAATSYEIEEPYQAFSKVELNLSETAYVEAGDNTGRVLVADCPIVSTTVGQTIANNVLSALSGFIYTPLTANGAILDPAMEIGDHITVGTTTSILATQETHFDSLCASDISAPGDDELDHEYPYESVQERKIERKISEIETTLYIGPDSIVSKVENLSDEFDDVSTEFSQLEQKVDGFTLSVTNGTTTSTIQLKSGSTVISSQTISMSGLVTFTDLSTAGQTTINGANITTGQISADRIDTSTLRVKDVWYYDETDQLSYKILSTEVPSINRPVNTYFGPKDITANRFYDTNIYGSYVLIGEKGAGDDLYYINTSLVFDTINRIVYPNGSTNSTTWSLGKLSNPFKDIYAKNIGFDDDSYLYASSSHLYYLDDGGTRHMIV